MLTLCASIPKSEKPKTMIPSPKITRLRPQSVQLRDDSMGHSFSLSLENLEDWDYDLDASGPSSAPVRMMVGPVRRHPIASTPINESHSGVPFEPIPCSPVRDINMIGRRGSMASLIHHSPGMCRPMGGRIPGMLHGPRPIRGPPAALGPKWRLFKRRTCPELLKTRSSDNLFR